MLTPHFWIIRQIEQMASHLPLKGLVLILAAQKGDQFLTIYLDQNLPKSTPDPSWKVKRLSELTEDDWLIYDGLSVGYDALDLVFPLFQTHGIRFYDIRRLFDTLDRSDSSDVDAHNSRELACWLRDRVKVSQRREEKLISLMLLSWQQDLPSDREILALAISKPDFPDYLSGQARPQWLDADALTALDAQDRSTLHVLTFKEAQPLLQTGVDWREWRHILTQNCNRGLYQKSLASLARALWIKGQQEHQESLQTSAWELALERWLPQWAASDVLAMQPATDFETFLENGHVRILTRLPVVATYHNERIIWRDFLDSQTQLEESALPWFALFPAIEHLKSLVKGPISPLEPLWLRSGSIASLAQAILGMTEDLREGELGKIWPHPKRELVWLTLRGLYLVGLGDPWDAAWGGRYSTALDAIYRLLEDVLLLAEQQSSPDEQPLFSLLRRWYMVGRQSNGSFVRSLEELRQAALDPSLGKPRDDIAVQPLLNAIDMLVGMGNRQSGDIEQAIEQKVDSFWEKAFKKPMPLIFDRFFYDLKEWRQVHDQSRALREAEEKPLLTKIEDTLGNYRRLLLCLHALPNEQALLKNVIKQDQEQLERLRTALSEKVILQVRLLTNPLQREKPTNLAIEIRNIGEQTGNNLKITLTPRRSNALEVENSILFVGALPPQSKEWKRVIWQVQAKEDPGDLVLTCVFQDGTQERTETFALPIEILQTDKQEQGPRSGNRFQAGIPVFGKNFFGRQEDLKKIFNILLSDTIQPVLLRGPRRIGKTSILSQVKYLLEQQGELQRLFGYTQEEEARIRRYRPIWASLQSVQKEENIPGWYIRLYHSMAESAGERTSNLTFSRENAHNEFVDLLKGLHSRFPEMHWLILLDEWDEQRHVENLGGKLRELMQAPDFRYIQWIFSSTWMLSEEAGRFGSPFYGQLKPIELASVPWDDARQMVLAISREMGITWEGNALVRLLDQTALRPYLIQRIGHDVIEHLSSSQPPSNLVNTGILDVVISNFVRAQQDPTSPFAFLWPSGFTPAKTPSSTEQPQASLSWLGRMILLILEEKKCPLSSAEIARFLSQNFEQRGWNIPENLAGEVIENLTQLEKIFDVLKVTESKFEFSIPLARAWFQTAIGNMDNPWLTAWEQLQRESSVRRRTNKEQK